MEFNLYDVSTKELVWEGPAACLERFGVRASGPVDAEREPRASMLWTATYLLMGLRYSDEVAFQLLQGVQTMKESTTYQAILREGRNEGRLEGRLEGRVSEAQRLLLIQGAIRFGSPDDRIRDAIEMSLDLERLERLSERVIDPNTRDWNDLLATP